MFETELMCDAIAQSVSEKLFDGRLPNDAALVTRGVMKAIERMFPNEPLEVIEELSNQMLVAISYRIAIERDTDAPN